jgi:type IX secretion system PorP/SprF family membrane protein|tara:strand:- start:835 stop:1677 length:843 start_codon:yes stop_codon:yes gene_type:complete
VLSPTYAGIGDHVKIRLNGLAQWVGIKDAPRTQSLAADMRLGEKSGIGLFLYNDSNGYTKQQGARISFAHHLTLDRYEDEFLSFGISYNFNQFRLDVEEFIDAGFDPGVTDDRSTSNHNFDVGLLYRKNSFYFSVNASNVINKDVYIFDPIYEPNKLRNFYAYTGYRYKKSRNSNMEIEPSLLYKIFESDGRSEADLNLKFRWYDFEDYYYAGVTYRFLNDQIGRPLYIAPLAGLKKSNFYFGYSYQIILNEILGYSTGTHVVTIGLDLFQGISNCRCTY